jgi:hypothetical protein
MSKNISKDKIGERFIEFIDSFLSAYKKMGISKHS